MKFNLSNFKKIRSDEHSTTLKHPDGHEIKIDHARLRPQIKKQLEALPVHLAEGTQPEEEMNASPAPQKQDTSEQIETEVAKQTPAANPMDAKFQQLQDSMRGQPVYDPTKNNTIFPHEAAYDDALTNAALARIHTGKDQEAATQEGQMNAAMKQKEIAQKRMEEFKALGITPPGDVASKASMNVQATGNPSQRQSQPANFNLTAAQSSQNPAGGITPNPDYFGSEAYMNSYMQGLGEQKQGIMGEANAISQQAKADAASSASQQAAISQLQKDYQGHWNTLNQERMALQKDISDGHVDPNQYIHSMGVGSRVATAIGIILGGFGGGTNPALEFLNGQINRNIDSQKAELGKKENLLSANMRQMRELKQAADLTRLNQLDYYSAQLKRAAAQAQDPMAKARALQAAGQLDQQAAPLLSQLTMKRTLMSSAGAQGLDPAMKVRFLVDEKEQPAAYKELQVAQNMSKQRDNLMNAFDQLTHINTLGNRAMSPIQTAKQVATLREPLLAQLVKDSEGRITPQDTEMLRGLFPQMGDSPQTVLMKRTQMQSFVAEKMHFPILDAHMIHLQGPAPRSNMNVPNNYQAPRAQMPMNVNYPVTGR